MLDNDRVTAALERHLEARPSGTEDVYKLCAESFKGSDHLRRIEEEAQAIIQPRLQRGRNRRCLTDDCLPNDSSRMRPTSNSYAESRREILAR